MEKANDIEDLIRQIADWLSIGQTVMYDPKSLTYGDISPMNFADYGDYLDMDELPENIGDELVDWEVDLVKYLREVLMLPYEMQPPRHREQFEWMADFANEHSSDRRFIRDVQRALDGRHPFGAYKNVMAYYGLLNDWYVYRDERYREYVRRELTLL